MHLRILAVSLEHNVDHAVLADTVNIAELRGGKIYPGNSAVGEVLAVGSEVQRFKPGDVVVTHCNGEPDIYGYPLRIWAYDQPESIGWYGEEAMVATGRSSRPPSSCGLNLWEIAALPLRAPTAYHLWRRGHGIFRLKVPRDKLARLNVLGFGGGVSELFLMQAMHEGHRAFFCSGSPARRAHLETLGIAAIDQKAFNRFADAEDDVKAFLREIKRLTAGVGMHIVCDMLRGPVFAAGVAALAREGVNVSAGWQLDKKITYDSAGMSVKQITLDHTHYDTIDGCNAATELYGSGLQADRPRRGLRLRGPPARPARDAPEYADRHPDRARAQGHARGGAALDPVALFEGPSPLRGKEDGGNGSAVWCAPPFLTFPRKGGRDPRRPALLAGRRRNFHSHGRSCAKPPPLTPRWGCAADWRRLRRRSECAPGTWCRCPPGSPPRPGRATARYCAARSPDRGRPRRRRVSGDPSTWRNGSKTCGSASASMPMPVSRTVNSASVPMRSRRSSTSPSPVNLIAFSNRLLRIEYNRS